MCVHVHLVNKAHSVSILSLERIFFLQLLKSLHDRLKHQSALYNALPVSPGKYYTFCTSKVYIGHADA